METRTTTASAVNDDDGKGVDVVDEVEGERLTLTVAEAAKLLGISRPTLYDLMQQHQIGIDA